jgi:hypothetical protein
MSMFSLACNVHLLRLNHSGWQHTRWNGPYQRGKWIQFKVESCCLTIISKACGMAPDTPHTEPAKIASVISFLAGPDSSFISGGSGNCSLGSKLKSQLQAKPFLSREEHWYSFDLVRTLMTLKLDCGVTVNSGCPYEEALSFLPCL